MTWHLQEGIKPSPLPYLLTQSLYLKRGKTKAKAKTTSQILVYYRLPKM